MLTRPSWIDLFNADKAKKARDTGLAIGLPPAHAHSHSAVAEYLATDLKILICFAFQKALKSKFKADRLAQG